MRIFTKRIVNYLIIVTMVSCLLFTYAYINSLVSHKYEVEDARGSLTAYQQDIVEQVSYSRAAIQISFSVLINIIGVRIGVERLTRKTG